MELLLLDADAIRAALPMAAAIECAREAYRAVSADEAVMPPRTAIEGEGGATLLMGARVGDALAAKVVSAFPENPRRGLSACHALALVLDASTGLPRALLDGTFLTAWRTGAAGGAAADLLAREGARVGCVFGAGPQARTQALALDGVRALDELRVVARRLPAAEALATELSEEVRARVTALDDPLRGLAGADLVVTATSATEPLFDGERLAPGVHVTAIGSFRPEMRELDGRAIERARVFVDSRAAALAEAGELIDAVAAGRTRAGEWTELGAVLLGHAGGRRTEDEITLFKSVGLGAQDAVAAAEALRVAEREGLGRRIAL